MMQLIESFISNEKPDNYTGSAPSKTKEDIKAPV
jgi:hypothetical protein